MTDAFDDPRFEQDLRAVLVDLAPDAAPGSLRAAVAAVPARRASRSSPRGRAMLAAIGLAAAVVDRRRRDRPHRRPAAGGARSRSSDRRRPIGEPSLSPAAVTLTFDVVTPDGSMATKDQVLAVEDVMKARLHAYGIGTFSTSAGDDRITFEMALPSADPTSERPCASCLARPACFRSSCWARIRSARVITSRARRVHRGCPYRRTRRQ